MRTGWGSMTMRGPQREGHVMLTIKHLTAHVRQKSPHARLHLAGVGMALALMLVLAPGAAAAPAGVNVTAVEGQSFTGNVVGGLTCPLASATITWGDGTSSAGTSDGANGIQGTHTFADEGTYAGSVSFIYQHPATFTCPSGTQTVSFQATVQDAPLTGTGVNVSGTAGQSLSAIVAHVDDANPGAGAGEFSAQINWGDGAKTFGTVAAAPAGGFDVSGSHAYASA